MSYITVKYLCIYCFGQELYLLLKLSDVIVLHYLCCLEFSWKIVSLVLSFVTPFYAGRNIAQGGGDGGGRQLLFPQSTVQRVQLSLLLISDARRLQLYPQW